jgi:hypothetical protein
MEVDRNCMCLIFMTKVEMDEILTEALIENADLCTCCSSKIINAWRPLRFQYWRPHAIGMLHPCSARLCHYNVPIRINIFLSTKQSATCYSVAAMWPFLCAVKRANARTTRPTYWWLTGHRWNPKRKRVGRYGMPLFCCVPHCWGGR